MVSGILLWVTSLGLSRNDLGHSAERTLLMFIMPSACVLATVRTLGPLWLFLIVATTIFAFDKDRISTLWARHSRLMVVNALATTVAVVASIAWIVKAGTNARERVGTFNLSEFDVVGNTVLWTLQSIAAFPTRSEQAPPSVYIIAILILLLVVTLGFRFGYRRDRWLIFATGVVTLVVPLLLSLATFQTEGAAWQGRYGLPYSVGIILLTGWVLDTRRVSDRKLRSILTSAWLGLVVMHSVGAINVLTREHDHSPSTHGSAWLEPSPVTVALLILAGCALWGVGSTATRPAIQAPKTSSLDPERTARVAY